MRTTLPSPPCPGAAVQPQHSSENHAALLGSVRHPGLLRRRGERQPGLTQAQDGNGLQILCLLKHNHRK